MDPFHERIARVALRATEQFGFCLAGGYAVAAHGMVERLSEDVDLFTTAAAERDFPTAVAAAVEALTADGLQVRIAREGAIFARLQITDGITGQESRVELGVDWRAYPPTRLAIGPVLHPDDAVANKMSALYSRAEVRDYIDVNGVLASGRYEPAQLLRLAMDHDPGFEPEFFAQALTAVTRFADAAYKVYGMDAAAAEALRTRLLAWSREIAG